MHNAYLLGFYPLVNTFFCNINFERYIGGYLLSQITYPLKLFFLSDVGNRFFKAWKGNSFVLCTMQG